MDDNYEYDKPSGHYFCKSCGNNYLLKEHKDNCKCNTLQDGDLVVVHSCYESAFHNGKVWTCKGEEFHSLSGTKVIFLEGYRGYFSVKYLQKVNIKKSLFRELKEKEREIESLKEELTKYVILVADSKGFLQK